MEPPPLGRYRHYKGGEYELVAIGKLESNLEATAIYHDAAGNWWVRALQDWLAEVAVGGRPVKRFTYLGS